LDKLVISQILNVITDAYTAHRQLHANFSHRLAQSSPVGQLNHAKSCTTGNAIATYNLQRCTCSST